MRRRGRGWLEMCGVATARPLRSVSRRRGASGDGEGRDVYANALYTTGEPRNSKGAVVTAR